MFVVTLDLEQRDSAVQRVVKWSSPPAGQHCPVSAPLTAVSVVLSGWEVLTLVGGDGDGGGVQRKDGANFLHSPFCPPPALPSLLSLAMAVTMPNHLTSGKGRRPQPKKSEGERCLSVELL